MWPFKQQNARRGTASFTDYDHRPNRFAGKRRVRHWHKPAATGALEASASIVARCFSAASVVSGPEQYVAALGPSTPSSLIGRALIRQGEIRLCNRGPRWSRCSLLPAASWDVTGDVDPASMESYRLTLGGPSQVEDA